MADLETLVERRFTYERTKRSRLTQSGFEGLKVMNLLNITWATGAMPIGAPGCPELALKVASICRNSQESAESCTQGLICSRQANCERQDLYVRFRRRWGVYREKSNGIDCQFVILSETHGREYRWVV